MELKKIQEAGLEEKKILLRVDFNVAVEKGKVKEKFKIEAAKKTLNYLLEKKCKIAVVSHFGRPEGKINPEFSLQQIKNDICGEESESAELFPAMSRIADAVNQYHIWVLPEGDKFPFGFNDRLVNMNQLRLDGNEN